MKPICRGHPCKRDLNRRPIILIDGVSMLGQNNFAWVSESDYVKLQVPCTTGWSIHSYCLETMLGCHLLQIDHGLIIIHRWSHLSWLQRLSKVSSQQYVVILLQQAGADPHILAFRELCTLGIRIEFGVITHNDRQALLQHPSIEASSCGYQCKAARLFYDKQSVGKLN